MTIGIEEGTNQTLMIHYAKPMLDLDVNPGPGQKKFKGSATRSFLATRPTHLWLLDLSKCQHSVPIRRGRAHLILLNESLRLLLCLLCNESDDADTVVTFPRDASSSTIS